MLARVPRDQRANPRYIVRSAEMYAGRASAKTGGSDGSAHRSILSRASLSGSTLFFLLMMKKSPGERDRINGLIRTV